MKSPRMILVKELLNPLFFPLNISYGKEIQDQQWTSALMDSRGGGTG